MLVSENICLRPWQEDDLSFFVSLRNDVKLQAQLLSRARGSREDEVLKWLHSWSKRTDRFFFVISDKEKNEALGFIHVSNVDDINRFASLAICLHPASRGRQIGGESIALLSEYLKDNWNIRKLELQVRADNSSALRCYEKSGFQRCGLLKEHLFLEARWHDVVLMECFLAK